MSGAGRPSMVLRLDGVEQLRVIGQEGTEKPYEWLLEQFTLYGVPLKRVLGHPAFKLGMRSVILCEGGNPDDWAGLRISPRTKLGLVETELGSMQMRQGNRPKWDLPLHARSLVQEARRNVTAALASMKGGENDEAAATI